MTTSAGRERGRHQGAARRDAARGTAIGDRARGVERRTAPPRPRGAAAPSAATRPAGDRRAATRRKPPLRIETTTLWEYPSQHYDGPGGSTEQGDRDYVGATPSWLLWQLLQRYTRPGDLVVDPMCGSGTTLDVAQDLARRAAGFDLAPTRSEIVSADARRLPLDDASADFVFVDPPYSTHVDYSDDPRCIGKLDAGGEDRGEAYYAAMEDVIAEIDRVLKPDRCMALYVSDSFRKGTGHFGRAPRGTFMPIGFELFRRLRRCFAPLDVVCVVRHSRKLEHGNYHKAAEAENFFLRGFNYLFIMRKPRERAEGLQTRRRSDGLEATRQRGSQRGPRAGARAEGRAGALIGDRAPRPVGTRAGARGEVPGAARDRTRDGRAGEAREGQRQGTRSSSGSATRGVRGAGEARGSIAARDRSGRGAPAPRRGDRRPEHGAARGSGRRFERGPAPRSRSNDRAPARDGRRGPLPRREPPLPRDPAPGTFGVTPLAGPRRTRADKEARNPRRKA
ncbi:MAG TPA: DNA methyltransferase [Phycisphaerales bacterium]|nr:DNA methyltransferase [Phycisphaerales bacterium]HMP36239.1 DNA methyltransferase [Phycisphaerales bacterium]